MGEDVKWTLSTVTMPLKLLENKAGFILYGDDIQVALYIQGGIKRSTEHEDGRVTEEEKTF